MEQQKIRQYKSSIYNIKNLSYAINTYKDLKQT
jgi:hypothetical protein